jgi:hypothetical protein
MVSNRNVQIEFSGVVDTVIIQTALENPISVGQQQIVDFAAGDNTITIPVSSGLVCTAVTIIPPSGNTVVMTLKGNAGDVGIALDLVDPTTLAIASTVTEIIINALTNPVVGVILIFS